MMNNEQRIKAHMVENGWTEADAEAARVYKSNGEWMIEPFNAQPYSIGSSLADAYEAITTDWELKQEGAI